MVLEHVAQCTSFLIILTTPFNSEAFGDGNLDIVYVSSIPDGLKNAISQPED